MMGQLAEASASHTDLTEKQRQVLDLVIEHKSSKEIARALGISPYTVDQRINAAREKLGAGSRRELARAYARLKGISEESVYDFSQVDPVDLPDLCGDRDLEAGPVFRLSDAATFDLAAPWNQEPVRRKGLEALDNRFGVLGRFGAIFGLAAIIALLLLAALSMAQALGTLI